MTGFRGDCVGLTFVFGDGGVYAVHDVRSNGSFEDCGERDCRAIGGCGAQGKDVDLWTGGLTSLVRNFTQILRDKFHRCIHHQRIRERAMEYHHSRADEFSQRNPLEGGDTMSKGLGLC